MDFGEDTASGRIVACHACDLLQRRPEPAAGQVVRCPRCGTTLARDGAGIDRALALTLAAFMIFALTLSLPFLSLSMEGRRQDVMLTSGMMVLYHSGETFLALLTLFAGIACPLAQLCGTAYVLLRVRLGRVPAHAAEIYRWVQYVRIWSMAEVMLLGILVSMSKLGQMARVGAGIGFYTFMTFVYLAAAAASAVREEHLWEQMPVTAATSRRKQPRPPT